MNQSANSFEDRLREEARRFAARSAKMPALPGFDGKASPAKGECPQGLAETARALRRRLARERGRARCGHRSYDLSRHIALHRALLAIEAELNGEVGSPAGRAERPADVVR